MIFSFDYNNRYEYPVVTLANPDFQELHIIRQLKDLSITPRFNSVSELKFTVYQYYDNILLPYYDSVLKNKLLHVEGFGWWLIDTATEHNDGGIPYKEVHAYSYEYTINYKGINLTNGTYKFYDLANPENTLMYKVMQALPTWKLGNVDAELLNLYRTFDVPDATLYGFLMEDVSNTYEVIFLFDTESLTINAYAPENCVKDTGIILTFDNLNKEIQVEELSTDIYTVLRVNGADNLSINIVNPLGDNKLYNFDYYNNENWIQDANLRQKITNWQNRIEELRPQYADLLNTLKGYNREMLKLKAELNDLNAELSALEIVRKNLTDQPEQFKIQTDLIDAKNIEIKNKQAEIDAKQAQIDSVHGQLEDINDSIRFDNYFTESERLTLDPFIVESVYTDENFIVTDQMDLGADLNGDTYVITTTGTKQIKDLLPTDIVIDEQYIANQLLEQGQKVLKQVSQPNFSFELDAANFLFMKDFEPFIKQLDLGSLINVEIKEGDWAYPLLLEMSIEYDNPTNFSMVFGNRFRMSTDEWTYAELHNETTKVTSQVGSTLGVAAEPVLNGTVNKFDEYMNSVLIAANQNIQSTSDNEVTMGSFGLRLRKRDDDYSTGYDPHQTWLNNNLICMTDDNWQSIKLAIGFIDDPSHPGQKYYGVNAEVIAGDLIAGNQLVIGDTMNTFVVDSTGAHLTNASFELTTDDGSGKIILNPDQGIKIQTNKGDGLKDNFYVTPEGYLMAIDITATGGTVGGFEITQDSIISANQNIILRDDGTGVLGLLEWDENSATFHGDIFADNLDPDGFTEDIVASKFAEHSIRDSKIIDLDASKLWGTITSDYGNGVTNIEGSSGYEIQADYLIIRNSYFSGEISNSTLKNTSINNCALSNDCTVPAACISGSIPASQISGLDLPPSGMEVFTAKIDYITDLLSATVATAGGETRSVVGYIRYQEYDHDFYGYPASTYSFTRSAGSRS